MGSSWGHLGPTWAILGLSWGHLGSSWCKAGASSARLNSYEVVCYRGRVAVRPTATTECAQPNVFLHDGLKSSRRGNSSWKENILRLAIMFPVVDQAKGSITADDTTAGVHPQSL